MSDDSFIRDEPTGPYDPLSEQALHVTKASVAIVVIMDGIAGSAYSLALASTVDAPPAIRRVAEELEGIAAKLRATVVKLVS